MNQQVSDANSEAAPQTIDTDNTTTQATPDPNDFEAFVRQATAAANDEANDTAPAADPTAEDGSESTESPEANQATEDPATEADPASANRLRVLARKERKVREQQERFKAEQKEALARVEAFESAKGNLLANPTEFFKSLDLSDDQIMSIVQGTMFQVLGENAPPSFKENYQQNQSQHQLATMRQKIAELEKQLAGQEEHTTQQKQHAAQAQYQAWQNNTINHIDGMLDDFPFIKNLALKDANQAVTLLFDYADRYYAQTQDRKIVDDPTFLAQQFNAELEAFAGLATPANQNQTSNETNGSSSQSASPKTLTNQSTSTNADRRQGYANDDEEWAALVTEVQRGT